MVDFGRANEGNLPSLTSQEYVLNGGEEIKISCGTKGASQTENSFLSRGKFNL